MTKKNGNGSGQEKTALSTRELVPIGKKLSFAASEAYKLLRANILFSASGEEKCQIIGITSSVRGEGKTTTSMNIAYTFAEAGKRVLLIDGDMRLPQVAKTLKLHAKPGLSNYLAGQTGGKIPVQPTTLNPNFFAIACGDIPPNPSELLGSPAMEKLLHFLSERFDCVIIDLPPINIVSDALVLSKLCDGYLVVVRQDYTSRRELNICTDQLNYVNAKLFGFVMTHSTTGKKGSYKGRYFSSRYGGRYGYRYGGRYGYRHGYGYGYGYGRGYGYGAGYADARPGAETDGRPDVEPKE